MEELRELLQQYNVEITYDQEQPMLFSPKKMIHYIYFKYKNVEYVISWTCKSIMFSKGKYTLYFGNKNQTLFKVIKEELGEPDGKNHN